MPSIALTAGELLLDLENPRISKATSQREALQKIIEDQDVKLVVLAESIVDDHLNPMDRWLVIKSRDERGKYTVLEGNRRFAAIKLLSNPSVMNDLEIRAPVKKKLEELSEAFNPKDIEPIDCFDIGERQAATAWLSQRHTGQNNGRGIVDWGGVATARFRGRDPALQAYELVLNYGGLSEEEKRAIEDRFPITTLDRLLSTPAVREKIGMEISDSKLKSDLPPSELIKPLRKMVLDLASGDWNVTKLKSKDQQISYVSKFGKDLPNLKKRTGTMKAVDGLEEKDFTSRTPKGWDDPKRMMVLLPIVLTLLGELAEFSGIEGDYLSIY